MKNRKQRFKELGRLFLFSAVLFILSTNIVKGQPGCISADLAAVSVGPIQPNIGLNQFAPIYVFMTNNGPCIIPQGEAEVSITFSDIYFDVLSTNSTTINFIEDCSLGGPGPEFVYLGEVAVPGFHVLYFRNDAGPMAINSSCYFQFDIKGKLITPVPQNISLSSSLSGTATVSDPNGTNQSVSAQVGVISSLAVQLSAFTAEMSDCNALLKWKSQQEINNKEYQVEASNDGRTFRTVGAVPASIYSGTALSYSFTDKMPFDGASFYRLKIIANDGHVEYSNIVTVNNKCNKKTVRVYPNPVVENQSLGVYILGAYVGTIKGELMSMSGQLIRSFTLQKGTNTVAIKGIAQGTYMMRVTEVSTGDNESFKVIVIK